MPKPYIFLSKEELIEKLQSKEVKDLASHFYDSYIKQVDTYEEVVWEGVTGNTFRAFARLPKPPSNVFRTWAVDYLNRTGSSVKNITTEADYAFYVNSAAEELRGRWLEVMMSDIGYGRAAKLFNLVLKKLACYKGLTALEKARLISFQHVPLDKFTIQGLRKIVSFKIPSTASMGHIQTAEQYQTYQQHIKDIAQQAKVPAIYYDILAWDLAH